jgi:hypothetical protein
VYESSRVVVEKINGGSGPITCSGKIDHISYLEEFPALKISYGCLTFNVYTPTHIGAVFCGKRSIEMRTAECTSASPVHSDVLLTATIAHNDLMGFDRLFQCGAARLYRTFHDSLVELS